MRRLLRVHPRHPMPEEGDPSSIEPPVTGSLRQPTWADVRWGVRTGVGLSLVFCAWIVVLMVLNGGLTLQMSGGHAFNALAVIALYLGSGVVGGAIVGLLRTFASTRIGAAVTGFLVALPVFTAVFLMILGFVQWTRLWSVIVVVASLLVGPFVALGFREINLEFDAKNQAKQSKGKE